MRGIFFGLGRCFYFYHVLLWIGVLEREMARLRQWDLHDTNKDGWISGYMGTLRRGDGIFCRSSFICLKTEGLVCGFLE